MAVLTFASLPLLLVVLSIRLTSPGAAIFVQKRVGRYGRPFPMFKLRTMQVDARARGIGLTKSGDARITWIGRWLRKLKLDELPQFYNVLRGEMSVVGPRPKLPEYAEDLDLICRPGITGAASLVFRNEEELLALIPTEHVESYYHERIKPAKAAIDAQYMIEATLTSDLRMIFSTFLSSLRPAEVLIPQLDAFDIAPPNLGGAEVPAEVSN